jgi:hypothetical protein
VIGHVIRGRYHNIPATRGFFSSSRPAISGTIHGKKCLPHCGILGLRASLPVPVRVMMRFLCLVVLHNAGLDGLGVCAHNLTDLLAVLEEDECRHGADTELLCNVGDLIDVELVEAGFGVLLREPVRVLATVATKLGTASGTYLTMVGAIILQGPHHVAKQSRTMKVSLASSACL